MSILTLDMQAMLFPPETEEGGEESHVSTFQRLDAKVPDDLFHFLANMSSFSGEFTAYANAMVSSGYCKSAKTLKDMPADAIARMGARLKMPAKSIENLVAAIHKANSRYTKGNFERVLWHDPRFDKPKKEKKLPVHQLMQIFDAADIDRSGTVSAEELRKQLSTDKELQQMLGLKVRGASMRCCRKRPTWMLSHVRCLLTAPSILLQSSIQVRHPVRGLVAVIDMDSLLNNIDKDSSGVVSWGEWRDAVTYVSARKVFDEVDKDGSGTGLYSRLSMLISLGIWSPLPLLMLAVLCDNRSNSIRTRVWSGAHDGSIDREFAWIAK